MMTLLSLFMSMLLVVSAQGIPCSTTWMYYNNTLKHCKCGDNLRRVVKCNERLKEVQVLVCYAMTYSEEYNRTLVGTSIIHCNSRRETISYITVSNDLLKLNTDSCSKFNREGTHCGRCIVNYSVPVYSYSLKCVPCTDYSHNWIKYLIITTIPVTVFYLCFILFRFRATNPIIHEFVIYSQLIINPFSGYLIYQDIERDHDLGSKNLKLITYTLLGIWNLDFGRFLYHPFCLQPQMSVFQALALDYFVAVYPLLLIFASYAFLKLHNAYRLVTVLTKPFKYLLRKFRKEWSARASLVDIFATFLLLSNAKIVNVSFQLISFPVSFYDMHGKVMPNKYTSYNGSMLYLGKDHIPYFTLGVLAIVIFNVLPVCLLCLYQCRWFQKLLNYLSLNRISLRIFMDSFQGSYKTSPRDYRYLSTIPFILRSFSGLLLFVSASRLFFSLFGVILMATSCVMAIFKPFRCQKQNIYNIIMYQALACLLLFSNLSVQSAFAVNYTWYIYQRIAAVLFYVPVLGILSHYGCKVFSQLYQIFRRHTYCINSSGVNNVAEANVASDETSVLLQRTI